MRPQEKMTARESGVAGDRDDVQVHLESHQHPARGGVGQDVAEQIGGIAVGDVLGRRRRRE